jgi:DNA (cytosine-5)-methyltransferase 1
MRFCSVCSGIEAASVAWEPLGWEPVSFAEIEAFPSAVLAHHWPDVPNIGNMEDLLDGTNRENFDLLVGGTPCQSFSVAGLRRGLDDPRGNLMLTYGAIADAYKPRWVVWENVPGVLSSNKGRDFGAFLGMLAQIGYGFAYRVLDAQFFGVAQRRRRVFVVGYLGDWRRAASVLFESESLRGDIAPSREKGEGIAFNAQGSACQGLSVGEITPTLDKSKTPAVCFEPRSPDGCARLVGDIAPTLNRMGGGQREPCICLMDQGGGVMNIETDVTGTLRSQTKGHEPIIMATGQGNAEITEGHAPTLNCNHEAPVVYFAQNTRDEVREMNVVGALAAQPGMKQTSYIRQDSTVRRLTPRECERLQGFPDDWTKIPWRGKPAEDCPDGPRYKALGNSMAVPVMRWIGERIRKYETANYNNTNISGA